VFGSCGLPSFSFLAPPDSSRIEQDIAFSRVTFDHNDDNDPAVFRGYDLFYKLYDDEPDGESEFESDAEEITADPQQAGPSRLTNDHGFQRLVTEFSQSAPTISIPRGDREDSFEITLTFLNSLTVLQDQATAVWTRPGGDTEEVRTLLRGGAQDNAGDPKPFFPVNDEVYSVGDGLAEIDEDLTDLETPSQTVSEDDLAVGLFVLSYGQDDDFTTVYSTPVSLGYYDIKD
jgi:hypothetical protein